MHCGYPVIGLLTAWKAASWTTRPLHILYSAWMFTAAVYLDHHWILDAIAGWTVAAVSVWAAGWGWSRVGLWGGARHAATLTVPAGATSSSPSSEPPQQRTA